MSDINSIYGILSFLILCFGTIISIICLILSYKTKNIIDSVGCANHSSGYGFVALVVFIVTIIGTITICNLMRPL